MRNYLDFEGQVALVTGGRRGLGRAMALALAERGAKVAVLGQNPDGADILNELKKAGEEGFYLPVDLADRDKRKTVVDQVLARFGRLDILINNAGFQEGAPLEEYTLEHWDRDLEVMLTAAFELAQQAAKPMIGQGSGKIINLASISSFQGARNIIGYSTVKHAIVGLTKCLANELAPHGINVNALAPGLFRTDLAAGVFADSARAEVIRSRIPDGRFGELEDIVGPMLFLAGEMSSHVHGHVLLVDGGWLGR